MSDMDKPSTYGDIQDLRRHMNDSYLGALRVILEKCENLEQELEALKARVAELEQSERFKEAALREVLESLRVQVDRAARLNDEADVAARKFRS